MAKARESGEGVGRQARGAGRRARRGLSDEAELERALELHRRIQAAMEKADLHDVDVAAAVGVHGDYVRNLARGGAKHPSFFTIVAMAAYLHVSPFWLAQITDDPADFRPPPKPARGAKRT